MAASRTPRSGDYVTAALVPQGAGARQGVVIGQTDDLLYLLGQSGLWYRASRETAVIIPLSRLCGETGNFVREVRDDLCPGWREKQRDQDD
jgi:hypothetical protein